MKTMRVLGGGLLLACCAVTPSCVGPPLTIAPAELPNAVEGLNYSQDLYSENLDLEWGIVDGALPAGLMLDRDDGTLSGRPLETGTFTFTVGVNSASVPVREGTAAYTLTVLERLTAQFALAPARVGEAYESTPTISGGVPPYAITIIGLPAGLDYDDDTGRIFGTPLVEKSGLQLEMAVTDNGDPQQSITERATLAIHPIGVTITTTELEAGEVGTAYSAQLQAIDGREPYTWRVSAGVLPDGLRLSRTTGLISGTPTADGGTATFTIAVTDTDSPASTDSREFKIVVPVVVITTTLAPAADGVAYEVALGAAAGLAPYTWAVSEGTLPDGLTLAADTGLISGTVTAAAMTETFTVSAMDADSPATSAAQELKLVVSPLITTTTLPDATIGVAYSETAAAAHGVAPYTWSLTAGALPAGLTLNAATGEISGTPAVGATSQTFTLRVRDSDTPAMTGTRSLTLTVGP